MGDTSRPNATILADTLAMNLMYDAMSRMPGRYPMPIFRERAPIRFLFYSSQFRPHKNILSLLKAYIYILREKHISIKLILTGNPVRDPKFVSWIQEYNLAQDVFCVHGLTEQELAAFYRGATLAVNPSFSEGGCPFTFTEALSVGTPVVMARIPVTEEVITCPNLGKRMLFDPDNWKNMANCIIQALENRDALLKMQMDFYNQVSQRSWKTVADEYLGVFDEVAAVSKV